PEALHRGFSECWNLLRERSQPSSGRLRHGLQTKENEREGSLLITGGHFVGRGSDVPATISIRVPLQSYRDLKVWQRALDMTVECYRLSRTLPGSEVYGLSSQIRRASVSVPANIAEGHGRKHLGDYLHHPSVARGSLMELETHLVI